MLFYWLINNVPNKNTLKGHTPGACIIKLIITVINSITYKASVFVKASKKWMTVAKALAYCTMELITYKKRLVSRINPSLLLKNILYNTWTLQLTKFDLMENYIQKLIKGLSLLSMAHW